MNGLIQKLLKLLERPGYRYLIIGGSVYVFELLVIVVAQGFGANGIVAVGLSFWLGFIVSFTLQKLVTFKDKRMHHRILLPQIVAVGLLVVFNFFFTIGFTALTDSFLMPAISRTFALLITTIWNFYLYKTRIFNPPEEPIY